MNVHTEQITNFAYQTRVAVIILQFVANNIIPDHDAKVFLYPKSNSTSTVLDKVVDVLLGGFVRWDAQYFMHIANYGYTYENTLAFFPLYPLLARTIVACLSIFIGFLNQDSLLLITFTIINVYLFTKAATTLYKLSALVLNERLAYTSAILFCINPATIFFVAPYTECLFSYLTFNIMLECVLMYIACSSKPSMKLYSGRIIYIIIFICLSISIRSNGILNIGFISYYSIRYYFNANASWIGKIIKCSIQLLAIIILCSLPFIFIQLYAYYHFCTNFDHNLPQFLIDYGKSNNFLLPGMISTYNQSWCFKTIPFAYSYIQDHYWNVGFLKYFELKQIPNFLLALPVVLLILLNSIKFFMLYKGYCIKLGLSQKRITSTKKFMPEMFVFIVHAVILTLFCILCINVQVTTRMICSASPVLYWYAAYYFIDVKDIQNYLLNINLFAKLNYMQKLILYYFVGYILVGTVLFCNFLPWT